ncbi:DNA invertase Pin-like site-specific DNA recombinase [Siphonobacter sp. BAB-5404]|nr:DNA invertase Pin-like site-specific DNA recombinase [Siphonobacter sp. SORGH_AS_0500]
MAQHERKLIADRTKKALVEKKKRGFVLGTLADLHASILQLECIP